MSEPDMPLNGDYSHGQAARWTKWIGHLAGKPELNALEVGSYEGQSAIWFCRNILTAFDSRLLCVDTWHGGEDMPVVEDDSLLDRFRKNTAQWSSQIDIMQERSDVALPMLHADTFDFAYIDGSHTASSVLSDSVLVWRLVKPGGIVIWDDYLWELPLESYPTPLTPQQKEKAELLRPKMAIDAFLACYQGKYELIAKEWQTCVRKFSS